MIFRLGAIVALAGCAAAVDRRPSAVDARGYLYRDNSGVGVSTVALSLEQPLAQAALLSVRGVVERIVLERKPLDPGDPGAGEQPTGHPPHAPDAVTSASATVGAGEVAEEWRGEGIAALALPSAGGARTLRALVKGSAEADYASIYASAGGDLEFNQRNTALGGFVGYGRDRVTPVEAPAGEEALWPAWHQRVNATMSVAQILGPRLMASAGLGLTWQWGQLASPYRRALVRTTLFPETHPDTRGRATAYAGLSAYLGRDVALHARVGGYADTWEVVGGVAEAAVAIEARRGLLLTVRYKLYDQGSAWFFEPVYHDLQELMTGDVRLGPIREHAASFEARWTFTGEPGEPGSMGLLGGIGLSMLDYQEYATDWIFAQVFSLGVTASY